METRTNSDSTVTTMDTKQTIMVMITVIMHSQLSQLTNSQLSKAEKCTMKEKTHMSAMEIVHTTIMVITVTTTVMITVTTSMMPSKMMQLSSMITPASYNSIRTSTETARMLFRHTKRILSDYTMTMRATTTPMLVAATTVPQTRTSMVETEVATESTPWQPMTCLAWGTLTTPA